MFTTKKMMSFVIMSTTAVSLAASNVAADTTTGFVIPNAFLDGNTDWTFNAPWQYESCCFSGAAVFITGSSNTPGFFAAEASPIDLTTEPNVTALAGYDPSTTELTGLTFSDPWRLANFGTIPADGEYNYFIEYTLETPGGSYRAATQKLDRATAFQNSTAQLGFNFTWQGGGFLGDPFAGGGGIPLDDILNQSYNVLIEVVTPTSSSDGFFLVEGFNLEYEVTSIPEPTTFALAGLCGFALTCGRRRNHNSIRARG